MVIRFLETVPSENPEFPFLAGQIINVACPARFLLDYLEAGKAEVIRADVIERAVEPPRDTPEIETRGRRRAKQQR